MPHRLAAVDVLADVLQRARAHGALVAHSELRGDWGLEFVDRDVPLSIHAVLAGELWTEMVGRPPLRLLQGDVLLVRSEHPYRFVHAPGAPARPIRDLLGVGEASTRERSLVMKGTGSPTVLLCGAYSFRGSVCDSLLDVLPETMPLSQALRPNAALSSVLNLLQRELLHDLAGQQAILDRLIDLSLVYALRNWFAQPGANVPPWYRALDDPVIGAALRSIHADPARDWTTASLARASGTSRAALTRRFPALTGQTPGAYLTGWRMTLAKEALVRPAATLASVANELGYASEFSFAAAFKREVGVAPGRWRSSRLTGVDTP